MQTFSALELMNMHFKVHQPERSKMKTVYLEPKWCTQETDPAKVCFIFVDANMKIIFLIYRQATQAHVCEVDSR